MSSRTASSGATAPVGVRFTETMSGFVTLGETDPERGYRRGKADGTALSFRLTISTDDVAAFLADPEHAEVAEGRIDCEVLGGRRPVQSGRFQLFVAEPAGARSMRYRLTFADSAGNDLTLVGRKDVRNDRGLDAWADTTTLFTRILVGHVDEDADADAQVTAAGILRISVPAFARQLTTFRADGPSVPARVSGLWSFGSFFTTQLWQVYGPRRRGGTG